MHTLFTDKKEEFKCNIDVEGTSLSETSARVVLKGDRRTMMFEGRIDSSGMCLVPISNLKHIFEKDEVGKLQLEVIADGTFFIPYESEFKVKASKNVTVEVYGQEKEEVNESAIRVKVTKPISEAKPKKIDNAVDIANRLVNEGITLENIMDRKARVKKIVRGYIEEKNLKDIDYNIFIKEIIKHL